jgi:SAM-dependent methyltransferase
MTVPEDTQAKEVIAPDDPPERGEQTEVSGTNGDVSLTGGGQGDAIPSGVREADSGPQARDSDADIIMEVEAATPPPVPSAAVPRPDTRVPALPPKLTSMQPPSAWPDALLQRPQARWRKAWFEEIFNEDYLRTLPFMNHARTLREVTFIQEALQLPPGSHVLDVACGYGRHAIELAHAGLRVTGLDLSLPMLIRAGDESRRRNVPVNFVHADMRKMAIENEYDGACCMLSSFGYFDEDTNLRVAASLLKALKPGARFLLDVVNRDYFVGDVPLRVWWEGDGCMVLEEVDFNFSTNRLNTRRSIIFGDGRQSEQDISMRAYSMNELGKLLRQAGFGIIDVSGSFATRGAFFGTTSPNIIVLCERPRE